MGQREQRHWEQYPGHVALGTTGNLSCGTGVGCGCWANKTVRIRGDHDSNVCSKPLKDEVGAWVPECLERVSVEECVRAIESFL